VLDVVRYLLGFEREVTVQKDVEVEKKFDRKKGPVCGDDANL